MLEQSNPVNVTVPNVQHLNSPVTGQIYTRAEKNRYRSHRTNELQATSLNYPRAYRNQIPTTRFSSHIWQSTFASTQKKARKLSAALMNIELSSQESISRISSCHPALSWNCHCAYSNSDNALSPSSLTELSPLIRPSKPNTSNLLLLLLHVRSRPRSSGRRET
jgi:hypothetical protein